MTILRFIGLVIGYVSVLLLIQQIIRSKRPKE
jgi:hypothetical protein